MTTEFRDQMDPSRVIIPLVNPMSVKDEYVKCRIFFEHQAGGRIVKEQIENPETHEITWQRRMIDMKTVRVPHGVALCPSNLFFYPDPEDENRKKNERQLQHERVGFAAIH